jgi:hypothetical protein
MLFWWIVIESVEVEVGVVLWSFERILEQD